MILLVFIAASILSAGLACFRLLRSENFYKGIWIGGVDISGLSMAEAENRLWQTSLVEFKNRTLSFQCGESTWEYDLSKIDFRQDIDGSLQNAYRVGRSGKLGEKLAQIWELRKNNLHIPLALEYDRQHLMDILKGIKAAVDKPPRNATISYENSEILLHDEVVGKAMDIDISNKMIENKLGNKNFTLTELQLDSVTPEITSEALRSVNGVIGSFATQFNPEDSNRTFNLQLASSRINGIILLPDMTFSMNQAIGPRTVENGYKEAPVIIEDELVPGIGGGVCQITTTLYGAVLRTKLQIKERVHHSMPLAYVDPGQDATIAENLIDFKFKNTLPTPVCIISEVTGGILTVRILGAKSGDDAGATIRSKILEWISPEPDELITDTNLPVGARYQIREGRPGLKVDVIREFYGNNGRLLSSEKLYTDYYKPVRGQIRVNGKTW